ncbi:MAG: hypothetical protein PF487_09080 [Bacteroidales bacterium]|jgi:hypothetical protein|nr:hypothetical protein [Bacteroidales bacterium]
MKDLIIKALDGAIVKVNRITPTTKKQIKSISIMDVNPLDLPVFMRDNNIPHDACFEGRNNGYDAWDDIVLSWDIDVPTTEDDKLKFKRKHFRRIAFRFVFDLLVKNEYKRIGFGFNYSKLKDFYDTTVYDMYMNKDFDRLVNYYFLSFEKI